MTLLLVHGATPDPPPRDLGDATSAVDKEDDDESLHTALSASLLCAAKLCPATQPQDWKTVTMFHGKDSASTTGTKDMGGTSAVAKVDTYSAMERKDNNDVIEQEVRAMSVSKIKSKLESLGISTMSFIKKGKLTDIQLRVRSGGRKSGAIVLTLAGIVKSARGSSDGGNDHGCLLLIYRNANYGITTS